MIPSTTSTRAGFTLIEILIVVTMIGLLAAIAVPAFGKLNTRSQNTAFVNDLRIASEAVQRYALENGGWPPDGGGGLPNELTGYLPPPDRWTIPTPVGGLWGFTASTLPTEFKATLIVTGYGGGSKRASDLDNQLDDGDSATGFLRTDGTKLTYVLEP